MDILRTAQRDWMGPRSYGLLSHQLIREPRPAGVIDHRHLQHGSSYGYFPKVHEAAFAKQRRWMER